MWLHASVLLNWVLLSEWSGRRGEVYDFGGLGCSQRLPLSVWVVPATLQVPVAGWPKKRELGPLSSGQGKSMQFVDPSRIEQSDHVQAASFAPKSISPLYHPFFMNLMTEHYHIVKPLTNTNKYIMPLTLAYCLQVKKHMLCSPAFGISNVANIKEKSI